MTRKWITFPRMEGTFSKQAHADLPENTYEREFGKEGFFGPVTHIHHAHPPTGWVRWKGDIRPRAFELLRLEWHSELPWNATTLMHNPHFRLRYWNTKGKMHQLVANADGDDLLFIHAGEGDFFCDFGHFTFREGDYILLPRSTRWRMECKGEAKILLMEATNNGYSLPEKGVLGQNAIFDPAMLEVPSLDDAYIAQQVEQRDWDVVIKRNELLSIITYPFNPLDTIGWHGDNLPVKLNWRDIRPVMSHRYHIPPSVHSTFLSDRFTVCTFVPRPMESDPGALKLPFYHSNNDYDEIIFYHQGQFMSRDNISAGTLTFHPCGFPHGPHPKAFETAAKHERKETDEVAVMIDTRDGVTVDSAAEGVEWHGYVDSWKGNGK